MSNFLFCRPLIAFKASEMESIDTDLWSEATKFPFLNPRSPPEAPSETRHNFAVDPSMLADIAFQSHG